MLRWITLLLILVIAAPAAASTDATICDRAATAAAHGSDVPATYLHALTRTETGRSRGGRLTPWPWTVNMEGAGHWFETRAEALAFVQAHHKRGARSFDIGCFQINYRWHGEAFESIAAMFDPLANARYAASFLSTLRDGDGDGDDEGDWRRAVGRYHSKTPKFANKYKQRFDRILANLDPQEIDDAPRVAASRPPDIVPARVISGEARGMARLALLDMSSGAKLVAFRRPAKGSHTPAGGVALLISGQPRSLLPAAKPLLN